MRNKNKKRRSEKTHTKNLGSIYSNKTESDDFNFIKENYLSALTIGMSTYIGLKAGNLSALPALPCVLLGIAVNSRAILNAGVVLAFHGIFGENLIGKLFSNPENQSPSNDIRV